MYVVGVFNGFFVKVVLYFDGRERRFLVFSGDFVFRFVKVEIKFSCGVVVYV